VLEAWTRRRKTAQALALRRGSSWPARPGHRTRPSPLSWGFPGHGGEVAVAVPEVQAGRADRRARPGRPRTVSDAKVEQVVTAALEQPPPGGDTHWSPGPCQASQGIAVHCLADLADLRLKPHVIQTWKLSTDPQFIDKVRDVVGLYMSPGERPGPVRGREVPDPGPGPHAPCLPMLPRPGPDDPRYVRNGTTSLFAAFDLASGSVIAQHYRKHRHRSSCVPQAHRRRRPEGPGPAPGPGLIPTRIIPTSPCGGRRGLVRTGLSCVTAPARSDNHRLSRKASSLSGVGSGRVWR